jgi:hypothetical protein
VIRSACLAWGVADEVCDDAELVASELVANVVDHAGTACTLDVSINDQCSRRGRGLQVVAAVSTHWGVTTFHNGKSVWALLPKVSPKAVLYGN